MLIILSIFLPILCAFAIQIFKKFKTNVIRYAVIAVEAVETALICSVVFMPEAKNIEYVFTKGISIGFTSDMTAKLFCLIIAVSWLLVTIYATVYNAHDNKESRFYLFMLLTEGAMIGTAMSSNLVSMYVFYELITLFSMPLVLHTLSNDAIAAAKKYLYYSVGGAFMALFGIFVLSANTESLNFTLGGTLTNNSALVLTAAFVMIIGFGAKAGMFPLHSWLPTAHPEAPAPASALLSGIIAKAGVLAIIRTIFFIIGPETLTGTWVQTALIIISLLTVTMGSMLAYREKIVKKRLAYSTVSQISYALTGLFLFNQSGLNGALWQIVFHAIAKIGLFLCAGAVIHILGKTNVTKYNGIGKKMPITLTCFTILSLSLIGIPPSAGFFSKWYLAQAALQTYSIGALSWIVPVVLLLSAILTAGYLLDITFRAFFAKADKKTSEANVKEPALMVIPIVLLTALVLFGGLFASYFGSMFSLIAHAAV